jgi:hypothetical protein
VDGVVTLVVVVFESAGGCEGVVDTTGGGFVDIVVIAVVVVVDCEAGLLACWVAPAAAAEYRIGVSVAGGRGC